ncbi:MAG TPA: TraB/GumN family protein, partial [Gammaproteobacteria bacterium]|nr:TraB/GumN family protein [Gammaproteobacteria bacterium]
MPSSSATTQSRAPSRLWKTSASAIAFLLLAFPAASVLAASHPLPLWRVSDGRGHVLYLAGAMHALTPVDYPLPAAMTNAFANSDRLVEELDLAAISPVAAAQTLAAKGRLPEGQSLAGAMGEDWKRAQSLAKAGGLDLAAYDKLRPWLAAVEIAEQAVSDAGYRPA